MGFQTQVNVQQAPAVAGDFCSANPRWSVNAGPGGLIAGLAGVTVGRFAWMSQAMLDPNSAPTIVNNFGFGPVSGFVHREQQALITAFLAESSNLVPSGFMITLMSGGDFWVMNDGTGRALNGHKAYANFGDGKVTFAATASAATASATGSIAAGTGSATGTISNGVMTLGTVTGSMNPGGVLAGTGVVSGTTIVVQLTGPPGGAGTYAVTPAGQTVASTTISETHGVFTAASALSNAFVVGGVLSGSGVTTTRITAPGTGTGGLGTYIVDVTQTASSTTITETTNVETKFVAMSSGIAGELIKITSHVLG